MSSRSGGGLAGPGRVRGRGAGQLAVDHAVAGDGWHAAGSSRRAARPARPGPDCDVPFGRSRDCPEPAVQLRTDLHCPVTASDGTDPRPSDAPRPAAGLDVIALTDHDTVAGHDEGARRPSGRPGQPGYRHGTVVPGSTLASLQPASLPVRTGASPELGPSCQAIREDRCCGQGHGAAAGDLGVGVTWEQVAALAGRRGVGRPHIARAMVAGGAIAAPGEAFGRDWIGAGGRAYVAGTHWIRSWPSGWSAPAGGGAVVAHPRAGRDFPWLADPTGFAVLAPRAWQAWSLSIPITPSRNGPASGPGRDLGLVATGGSDDHGASPGTGSASRPPPRRVRETNGAGGGGRCGRSPVTGKRAPRKTITEKPAADRPAVRKPGPG